MKKFTVKLLISFLIITSINMSSYNVLFAEQISKTETSTENWSFLSTGKSLVTTTKPVMQSGWLQNFALGQIPLEIRNNPTFKLLNSTELESEWIGEYITGEFPIVDDNGIVKTYYYKRRFQITYEYSYSYTNLSPSITINSPFQNQSFSNLITSLNPTIVVSDADGDSLTCNYYLDSESSPRDTKVVSNTKTQQNTTPIKHWRSTTTRST